MKKVFIILISLTLFSFMDNSCYPTILILQEKARGCDVVITECYFENPNLPFSQIKLGKKYITPSLDMIKRAEDIFHQQLNKYYADLNKINPNRFANVHHINSKKYFRLWKRQYIGYVNHENDTIILMNLMNFKRKKKAEKNFENWDKYFFTGMDGYYTYNLRNYQINICKKKYVLNY